MRKGLAHRSYLANEANFRVVKSVALLLFLSSCLPHDARAKESIELRKLFVEMLVPLVEQPGLLA